MTASYFENMPLLMPGSTTIANSVSTIHVVPFVLPDNISCSILRVPIFMSRVSTNVAGTSANTTFSFGASYTQAAVLYSQGTGASSNSLQSVFSGGGVWNEATGFSNGTAGTQYTVSLNQTFPLANWAFTTDSHSQVQSTDSYRFATNVSQFTLRMTSYRFVDIPFATSLSAGQYWFGFGMSTSTASNAGPDGLQNGSNKFSTVGVSQSALSWGHLAAATNNSIQIQPGLGIWTTNSAVMSTASMDRSNISAVASNPKMYFQLINRA